MAINEESKIEEKAKSISFVEQLVEETSRKVRTQVEFRPVFHQSLTVTFTSVMPKPSAWTSA